MIKYSFRLLALVLVALTGSANKLMAMDLWSNPATWPSGSVPQAGDVVHIPMGMTVLLDVSPPELGGLQVNGTLVFAETPLHLATEWIMVMMGGELRIGLEDAPHHNPARITLTGDDQFVSGLGLVGKMIGVMDGGVLNLHGTSRDALSWSLLNGTVDPGATSLNLVDNPTWKNGDRIVIAPSGINPLEAEEVVVTSVSGLTVNFSPPLMHRHCGMIQDVDGKALDMRAEVGLLTRNIVIEGNEASETTKRGGHVMIMPGGHAFVEGVEFYRMGQFSEQGRYPLHWHLCGPRYDNYARGNSVRHSFHRGMVIHGTDGVTLENNVIYDITSHGYVVAEDGDEEDNIILNNLGVLIHQIINPADYAFPDPTAVGFSSQSESRPGVFWMKNPNQVLQGNRAAGSVDGIGFFYDGVGTATSVRPDFFVNNVAHSHYSFFEITINERYPPLTRGHGLFIRTDLVPGHTLDFQGLTAYMNSVSGAWMEEYGQVASNAMLADNGSAAMMMRATLRNSTVLYNSDNPSTKPVKRYGAINTVAGFGGKKDHRVENVRFYGHPSPLFTFEDSLTAPRLSTSNIAVSGPATAMRITYPGNYPVMGAMRDEDGSLTGKGVPSLVFHQNFPLSQPSCVVDGDANTMTCPMDDYLFLRVYSKFGAARPIGKMNLMRQGGAATRFFSYETPIGYEQYQYLPRNSRYRLSFVAPPLIALPSLFNLEAQGSQEGYLALRVPLDPGMGAYLLNQYDELLPAVSSINELSLTQSNYYLDPVANMLYLILHVDAAGAFFERVQVYQVPATAFLRDEQPATADASGLIQPVANLVQDRAELTLNLPYAADARLILHDMTGRVVQQWLGGELPAGQHPISLSTAHLPAGTYLYRLQAGSEQASGKLVVAR
jgi:hypothetical protein